MEPYRHARVLLEEGHAIKVDEDVGTRSTFHRRAKIGGKWFDVRHHGKMGMTPRTKASYHRMYAADIAIQHWMDCESIKAAGNREVREGDTPPDFAIRSHLHQFQDSGDIYGLPTRAIALPAWQAFTSFTHKVVTASTLSDIGAVLVILEDGCEPRVKPIIYKPERPTAWVA